MPSSNSEMPIYSQSNVICDTYIFRNFCMLYYHLLEFFCIGKMLERNLNFFLRKLIKRLQKQLKSIAAARMGQAGQLN